MTRITCRLQVEAVGRVAERLLRDANRNPGDEVFVSASALGSELAGIVHGAELGAATPLDRALAELAIWSRYHVTRIGGQPLCDALLIEAVAAHLDRSSDRGAFMAACARSWDALSDARAALDRLGLALEESEAPTEPPPAPDATAGQPEGLALDDAEPGTNGDGPEAGPCGCGEECGTVH